MQICEELVEMTKNFIGIREIARHIFFVEEGRLHASFFGSGDVFFVAVSCHQAFAGLNTGSPGSFDKEIWIRLVVAQFS